MTPIRHTIIGLPQSGKTTFLAALWHILNADDTPDNLPALQLEDYDGDFAYLNQIRDFLMSCSVVRRTPTEQSVTVSIHVRHRDTATTAVLEFPDLSGESFELQLEDRMCEPGYLESLSGEGGILLFVTANQPRRALSVVNMNKALGDQAETAEPGKAKNWKPKLCPPEVQLVDLLQFLQRPPFPLRRRRVGVIVSAWDQVDTPDLTPDVWVQNHMSLLYQFLVSNTSDFETRFYGVSAQGGDFKTADRTKLLARSPGERVICVGEDVEARDFTAPIVWLMRAHDDQD